MHFVQRLSSVAKWLRFSSMQGTKINGTSRDFFTQWILDTGMEQVRKSMICQHRDHNIHIWVYYLLAILNTLGFDPSADVKPTWNDLVLKDWLNVGKFSLEISASFETGVIPVKCFILWPWQRMKLAHHYKNILCDTLKRSVYVYVVYFIRNFYKKRSKTLVEGQLFHVNSWIKNSLPGQTDFYYTSTCNTLTVSLLSLSLCVYTTISMFAFLLLYI
jgi:hypothetical protein